MTARELQSVHTQTYCSIVTEHRVNICNIYCLLPGKVQSAGEKEPLRKKTEQEGGSERGQIVGLNFHS